MKILKILLIRYSALGDVILSASLLDVLRKQYPDSAIDIITKKAYYHLFENHDLVRKVIVYNPSNYHLFEMIRIIRAEQYDIIIDAQNKIRSRLWLLLSKAKKKIFFQKRQLIGFFTQPIFQSSIREWYVKTFQRHIRSETFKEDASYLPEITVGKPPLYAINNIEKMLVEHGVSSSDVIITMNHSTSQNTKKWPSSHWMKCVSLLPSHWKFILLGDPKDPNDNVVNENIINNCTADMIINASHLDIPELMAVIAKSNIIISVDSGVLHLAHALKKPVIGIFGPTSVQRWGYSESSSFCALQNKVSCQPCSNYGNSVCPQKHHDCMNKLFPETVAAEILQFFKKHYEK